MYGIYILQLWTNRFNDKMSGHETMATKMMMMKPAMIQIRNQLWSFYYQSPSQSQPLIELQLLEWSESDIQNISSNSFSYFMHGKSKLDNISTQNIHTKNDDN